MEDGIGYNLLTRLALRRSNDEMDLLRLAKVV
jgi:hypothetical protein